jgi:hypothetical protein
MLENSSMSKFLSLEAPFLQPNRQKRANGYIPTVSIIWSKKMRWFSLLKALAGLILVSTNSL